jgi:hypothetical protein
MTHDDEQTARRLINDAMSDAYANAPTIENATQLIEMVASALRDEHDLLTMLRAGNSALFSLAAHNLGEMPNHADKLAGVVGLTVLALSPNPAPIDLLDMMTNDQHHALGLIHLAEPDDEPAALMLVAANPDGELIGAVAQLTDPKMVNAFTIDDADIKHHTEHDRPNMVKTFIALSNAAKRRAQ